MKLQEKTALVFIFLLIGLLLVCSFFISSITLSSYSSLEQQYLDRDLNQAVNKLTDEENTLSALVSDWGPWDDSYDFVIGKKTDFIETNLLPDTFDNLALNVIIITDKKGTIVYSGSYDLVNKTAEPLPDFIASRITPESPLLTMTEPRHATTGILMLPNHPMIVASRPIVHTDFSGNPEGVVIMGRYLDEREITRLSEFTQPSLNLIRLDGPSQLPRELAERIRKNGNTSSTLIETLNTNQIAGYTVIRDLYGSDALVLEITEPRDIYRQGVYTTYTFILIILGTGLLFGMIVIIILDRLVLSRLGALNLEVHSIGDYKDAGKRVEIGGNDEFSGLADQINLMLESLEKSQTRLQVSETRFRELSELLPQVIFEMDPAGRISYVNREGAEQFGITGEMIREGVNIRRFLSPDNTAQMQRGLAAVLDGAPSLGEVYSLNRQDGTIMKAIVSTSLIKKDGGIAGFRGIVVDVTERMQLSDQLEESTKLLTGILQASPVGVFQLDESGRVTFVNETFTTISGIPMEKIRGTYWADILPEEERYRVLADVEESVTSRKTSSTEFRYIHPDGTPFWLFGQTVPILDIRGSLSGWVGTITDITRQKLAEEALKENEEYLKTVIDSVQVGILVIDSGTHKIVDANPAALAVIGTSRDEILGKVCHKYICPTEIGNCPVTDLGKSIDNSERVIINAKGERVPIIKYVIPVMLNGTRCLLETFIDNSYRKKIEEALKDSEEKYRALTENTPDILFSTTMNGIITYASPQINKYGFLEEEVIGKSLRVFIHPADIERVEANLAKEIEEDAQFISQFRILDKWETVYWFEEKSTLRLDLAGKPIGIYGIMRDVTERKRVEDAIDIANKKLNLMNQITRHDILNTITGLFGCVDMAKATGSPQEKEELLNEIRELTKVIQRHISFTREYQEVGVHLPQWQNVNQLIDRTVQNFTKSGLIFHSEFEKTEVYADPLLEKVFYNLIDNAIRYGEKLTTMRIYPAVSDKGFSLIFEDDGVGVPESQKQEIFKRGVGKNTGMGLFLTSEILAITGITIEENGMYGKGARFEIRIPNGTWRLPRK